MHQGKKIAVMQPYLFPYLGYLQLMEAVDHFILLDDVSFINRGWVNRNNILVEGKPKLFTLPLSQASQNKLIHEIEIFQPQESKEKLMRLIHHSYAKAPFYKSVEPFVEEMVLDEEKNVSRYIFKSLKKLKSYLQIQTELSCSSEISKKNSLKGQDRIIELVKIAKGHTYMNPIGGQELYNKDTFSKNGIHLCFLKPSMVPYTQFQDPFVPQLSILDVLMFNSREEMKKMLGQFKLVT